MLIPLDGIFNQVEAFILIFVRITGLFVIAPIFGRRNIPTYFKIGLSFMIAVILLNTVTIPKLDYFDNIYMFAFLVAKEFIVGVTIGYVSYLLFTAIYLAGQLIDMQVGFGMVNVLDPMSNIQVPITANFYFIISMMIFLMANGHHVLLRGLFESYTIVPLGGASFSPDLVNDILRMFGNIFLLGVKIASPIIAAILVSDVALGVISKTIPQLNVFVVGMPLKIVLGIAVVMLTIPLFISIVDVIMNGMNSEMMNFMKDLGQTR